MNASEITANRRMKRIKNFSKVARAILLALLIVEGLALMALPVLALELPRALKSEAAFKNCSSLVAVLFVFLVTSNFFRLFTRLSDGHLFDSQTIACLERAGKWWIIAGIVKTIFDSLAAAIFRADNVVINGPNGIIAGLIMFFIAWLFGEAQKLREEQELTV